MRVRTYCDNLGYNCAASQILKTRLRICFPVNLTNCINQRSCLKPYISPREALHRIFPSGNKRLRTRVFNLMHCKPVLISCSKLQTLKKDKINTIEGNSIKTWRSIVKSVEDGCRGPKAQQQYCAKHPAQRSRALQLFLPFFVLDFYFNYAFCKLLSHFVVQHTRHSTVLWCLRLRGGDRERVTICLRISVLVRVNARHAVCHICGKINDGRICKYNSKIHVESELGYYPLNVLK